MYKSYRLFQINSKIIDSHKLKKENEIFEIEQVLKIDYKERLAYLERNKFYHSRNLLTQSEYEEIREILYDWQLVSSLSIKHTVLFVLELMEQLFMNGAPIREVRDTPLEYV